MAETQAESSGALWRGIGTAVGLPIFVLTALGLAEVLSQSAPIRMLDTFVAYTIGLSQWFWIVPMARRACDEGRPAFARGLKAGAWIIFVPYFLVFGLLGGVEILLHLDLSHGFPFFYTHSP